MPIHQYLDAVLLVLVSSAAVNDLATRRIPNRLLLAGLASALLLHAFSVHPGSSLLGALGGLVMGLALFLPLYLLRGMAAGDVKLLAVVGAFMGPADTFAVAVLTWCAGGIMALLMVTLRGRLGLALGNLGRMLGAMLPGMSGAMPPPRESAGAMPYGVAIAAGTITVMVRHYG